MRDTICALATPPGQSALAIVRVSGPEASEVLSHVFRAKRGSQEHFVATRGDVLDVDDAICISFPEGKSFTGEPSFELTLHGNPLIATQVLEALRRLGCRTARPGEFSMRAYLNGKIDLAEAEAIADLIHARSEEASRIALRNLKGGLSKYLEPTRAMIIDLLCEIEARLDFPDEDIGQARRDALSAMIRQASDTLAKLLATANTGRRLMEGARVVLVGLPNAGKSTLLNTLLGEDKALVHDTPGTTRDVIEASWILNGMPVTLVDVAGIRDGDHLDPVERLGIERARAELERADLILWLSDNAHEEGFLPECIGVPVIKIQSKVDRSSLRASRSSLFSLDCFSADALRNDDTFPVSSHTGEGLEALKAQISSVLLGDRTSTGEAMLTRVRQKEEVQKARECLLEASEALLRADPDEIVAFELRTAGQALDRLLGKSLNEDVLDLIFSRFCIGK
jgi:tRNA modification GTPase